MLLLLGHDSALAVVAPLPRFSERATDWTAAVSLLNASAAGGVITAVGPVQKDVRNPLFAQDKPWEPRLDNGCVGWVLRCASHHRHSFLFPQGAETVGASLLRSCALVARAASTVT